MYCRRLPSRGVFQPYQPRTAPLISYVLSRAYKAQGLDRDPRWNDAVKHAFGFARKTVDTFAAWMGGMDPATIEVVDRETLDRVLAGREGILLIVSHLGNIDISRALLDKEQRSRIKLLVQTIHAQKFARILQQFRPEAIADTIQVTEVNPGTMIALKEVIESGGWVAIAGDRTPLTADARVSRAQFLGYDAPFPDGPYLLAHLLECPVYLMFCLRRNGVTASTSRSLRIGSRCLVAKRVRPSHNGPRAIRAVLRASA